MRATARSVKESPVAQFRIPDSVPFSTIVYSTYSTVVRLARLRMLRTTVGPMFSKGSGASAAVTSSTVGMRFITARMPNITPSTVRIISTQRMIIAQLRLEPRGRESGSVTGVQANRYRALPMTKHPMFSHRSASPEQTMTERLGFAGLGIMGSGMASNLVAKGHPLTVWNRTRSKAEAIDGARRGRLPRRTRQPRSTSS